MNAKTGAPAGEDETPGPSGARLERTLGLPALVFFGLAYMVPLTVFTTYGVVTQQTNGHLPLAYVFTLAAMVFTAASYGRMVVLDPNAGSAYSYARRAFGSATGLMVGWALLLDYLLLPMINMLVIGIYMQDYFPAVPQAVWILAALVLVTILNVLGIRLVARMNVLIITFQLVFLALFVAMAAVNITRNGAPAPWAPFYSSSLSWLSIAGGAAVLCLSFLGFDAVSTLSEEARRPRRDLPRATMYCTLLGGLLFIAISWIGSLAFPDWHDFTNVDSAAADIMRRVGGIFLVTFFTAAYVAGCLASAMAAQASVARILYAMGRDRLLPAAVFGRISERFATPVGSILVVAAICLLALVLPLSLVAATISFGALVAFSFVNLSVIKTHLVDRTEDERRRWVACGLMPAIGFALTVWLWTSLSGLAFWVGLSWVAAGLVYLLYLTRLFQIPVPEYTP